MSLNSYAKITNLTYTISTLIFFIAIIVTYSKLGGSDYNYMYNLGQNWKIGPIISVEPSGKQCTAIQQPIITNFWPGTSEGCFCKINTSFTYGPLRRGHCNKNRDSYIFCSTVKKLAPKRWQNWRGKYLCGKRVDTTYLDLIISKRAESCPMNTKPCGIIDSLNNVMCVPRNTKCPINSIQINTKDLPIPKEATVINGEGAKIVFANDNIKGKIVNELYVGEDQPCANPHFANYNYKPYLLDYYYSRSKCLSKIGSFTYDERYSKLDKGESIKILKDNGIFDNLRKLPTYNSTDYSHEMSLYQRGYIGLDSKCLEDIKYNGSAKTILNDLIQLKNKIGNAIRLTMVCLIFGIVLLIFMIIFLFMGCLYTEENEINDIHKFTVFMMIIPMILELSIFIMSIVTYSFLKSYSGDHQILQKADCVDDLTFAATSNFYPSINSGKVLTIFNILLTTILFTCKIVQIFICCKRDDREGFNEMPETNTEMAHPQN